MTEKEVTFKFPRSSCEQSVNCEGCHERSDWNIEENDSLVIHNKDVITYQTSLKPLPQVYYEIFSTYEDSLINEEILPGSHGLSVDQFLTLDEVRPTISCYACGGCSFIVYKVKGWIRTPICVNGWKGYSEDGWL
jgi:hypothetical protein